MIFAATLDATNLSADFMLWGPVLIVAGVVVGYFVSKRLLRTSDRPVKIQEAAAYNSRGAAAPRMLVIRGVDDEAALSLVAGAICARVCYFIMFSTIRWVLVAFLVVLLCGKLLLNQGTADLVLRWLIAVAAIGALAFFFLFGVFKSVFGKEFVIGSIRCEIAVD